MPPLKRLLSHRKTVNSLPTGDPQSAFGNGLNDLRDTTGKPNSETDFRPATFHRNGDCVGNTLAVLCSGGSVSAVPMAGLLGVIELVSLHTHTQRGVVHVEVPEVASELTRASPTAVTLTTGGAGEVIPVMKKEDTGCAFQAGWLAFFFVR